MDAPEVVDENDDVGIVSIRFPQQDIQPGGDLAMLQGGLAEAGGVRRRGVRLLS